MLIMNIYQQCYSLFIHLIFLLVFISFRLHNIVVFPFDHAPLFWKVTAYQFSNFRSFKYDLMINTCLCHQTCPFVKAKFYWMSAQNQVWRMLLYQMSAQNICFSPFSLSFSACTLMLFFKKKIVCQWMLKILISLKSEFDQ